MSWGRRRGMPGRERRANGSGSRRRRGQLRFCYGTGRWRRCSRLGGRHCRRWWSGWRGDVSRFLRFHQMRCRRRFSGCRSWRQKASHAQQHVAFKRTGVCLLLFDAQFWQQVDNHAGLYFQLTRQFINSNLTHTKFPGAPPPDTRRGLVTNLSGRISRVRTDLSRLLRWFRVLYRNRFIPRLDLFAGAA